MTTTKEKLLQLAVVLVITVPIAVVVWFIVAPDKNDANPAATLPPPSATSRSTSPPSSTPAPSTEPKPAQTFPPEHQPIVDAYWAYYDALYSLRTQTDDLVRVALSPYAADSVVEYVVQYFADLRAQGREPGGFPIFGTLTIATDGQTALVRECRDSSHETVVDVATGSVVETGTPNMSMRTDFTFVPGTNSWQITTAYSTEGAC